MKYNYDSAEALFKIKRPITGKSKKCARCDSNFTTTRLRSLLCSDCWEYVNILESAYEEEDENGAE